LPSSNGRPGAARRGLVAGGGRSQGEWKSHRFVPSAGEGEVRRGGGRFGGDGASRVTVMDDADRVGGPDLLR
jgi:hypothetical protein